jgi:acetyl-CoA carboxylase biotin carboxyl carrier protein
MRRKLYRKIRELVSILGSEDIDEIELRQWWTTVRVARRRPAAAAAESPARSDTASSVAVESSTEPSPVVAAQALAEQISPAVADGVTVADSGVDTGVDTIVSPMVGTFYRAPAPDSEPFVNVGDRVEIGEVLCVIEAMKLMNEIEADRGGVI